MRRLIALLVQATSHHLGFDLGFGFRLSQSVQIDSPNQGGSGGVGGIGSSTQSDLDASMEKIPKPKWRFSWKLLAPKEKDVYLSFFRSPFFVRHIDVLKFMTIRKKQVSDWAFLPLDEVHYDGQYYEIYFYFYDFYICILIYVFNFCCLLMDFFLSVVVSYYLRMRISTSLDL